MRRYTVLLKPEPDGGYAVSAPALPGLHTLGDTEAEALDMMGDRREAVALARRHLGFAG